MKYKYEKPLCLTIQMKAIEQYFHVVLFIMLYKVILGLKFISKSLISDHSDESYWAAELVCGCKQQ